MRDILTDVWSEGVDDLDGRDRSLMVDTLYAGLRLDCENHGFQSAPVCRPGDMRALVHAVTKAKKKQAICQMELCEDVEDEEDGAKELDMVEEEVREGKCGVTDTDLDCAPNHLCGMDTAGGLSVR